MAKKNRIRIEDDLAARVLFKADHTCCKCRERGRPVQIHHINSDPSDNAESNLSTLCTLCHDETMITGGFGRKLNATLVLEFRNDWIQRVELRRAKADELAAIKMSSVVTVQPNVDASPIDPQATPEEPPSAGTKEEFVAYVESLPSILKESYELVRPGWASPVTSSMAGASNQVTDVVVTMLVQLSGFYPLKHFGEVPAEEYFSEYLSQRARWQRAISEPDGVGTGGTIVQIFVAGFVLGSAEEAVVDIVRARWIRQMDFNFDEWLANWNTAKVE